MVQKRVLEGKAVRRRDVVMVANRINAKEKHVPDFKGSERWLSSVAKQHKLRIKRVTKFVGHKKYMDEKDTSAKCESFMDDVKKIMTQYPPEAIMNMDQTGVNRELVVSGKVDMFSSFNLIYFQSARYLALPEERQVIRTKLSSNGDKESVTAMPIFRSDGTLHENIYLQFKEATGSFPKRKGHFKAKNVIAVADKTSIMSYKTFETCLRNFVSPAISNLPKALLLLDSWKPFLNHDFIKKHLPSSCNIEIVNIPGGGTSQIQPADVGLYRQHKLLLKSVHDHVRNFDLRFDLHSRDGIIKVLSLIHRQLGHPRFKPFLLYAWHKAGYLVQSPGPFETPSEVLIPRRVTDPCSSVNCSEPVGFILCLFCNNFFCATHFFHDYHWC